MRNDPEDSESKLGFDRNRTVGEKLYRTLVLLLLAGFFGIFTALVVSLDTDPWVKFAAAILFVVAVGLVAYLIHLGVLPVEHQLH